MLLVRNFLIVWELKITHSQLDTYVVLNDFDVFLDFALAIIINEIMLRGSAYQFKSLDYGFWIYFNNNPNKFVISNFRSHIVYLFKASV